jgi:hypothetical protein
MGSLETVFGAVVVVLAGLAVVGALLFAISWEWSHSGASWSGIAGRTRMSSTGMTCAP